MKLFSILFAICIIGVVHGKENATGTLIKDLEFAKVDGVSLKLDLYLPPKSETPPPLVVWIHGGGWRGGDKSQCELAWLTEHGFAVASISYRLTDKAIFPAQIHDCKGAVRWLRANAEKYGFRTDKIVVAGSSAGGHLAALFGTTNGVTALEGEVGGNVEHSSRINGIIDFYGASDFIQRIKSQPHKTIKEGSIVNLLLGGPADQNIELAKLASSAFHVTADDPELLIFHGRDDDKVLLPQSERLRDVYRKNELPVTLHILEGCGHGGKAFYTGDLQRKRILDFLKRTTYPLPHNPPAKWEGAPLHSIYNGKDLNGWHHQSEPGIHGTGGHWGVTPKGELYGEQDPPGSGNGGLLLSDQTYGEFELKLELRPDWGPCSGIFLRANERGEGWQVYVDYHDNGNIGHLRLETKVHSTPFRPFSISRIESKKPKLKTTLDSRSGEWPEGVYEETCSPEDFLKVWNPSGWNEMKIRCTGKTKFPVIEVWIRDLKICKLDTAKTTHPKFDREKATTVLREDGSIGFQVHRGNGWPKGTRVFWRNIDIREL